MNGGREYLEGMRIPQLVDKIVSALVSSKPDRPREFIADLLREKKGRENGISTRKSKFCSTAKLNSKLGFGATNGLVKWPRTLSSSTRGSNLSEGNQYAVWDGGIVPDDVFIELSQICKGLLPKYRTDEFSILDVALSAHLSISLFQSVPNVDITCVVPSSVEQHCKSLIRSSGSKVRIDTAMPTSLPYDDSVFQLVTCCFVLDSILTEQSMLVSLNESFRVLSESGVMLVAVFDPSLPLYSLFDYLLPSESEYGDCNPSSVIEKFISSTNLVPEFTDVLFSLKISTLDEACALISQPLAGSLLRSGSIVNIGSIVRDQLPNALIDLGFVDENASVEMPHNKIDIWIIKK